MKQSDINHLRRLVGWVSCEIGQGPAELVATVRHIASKIQLPSDPKAAAEAKQRLVEAHDKARRVPAYIRAAVVALEKALAEPGMVVEARQNRLQNIPEIIPADAARHPVDSYNVYAVSLADQSRRLMVEGKTKADAEAFVNMAVIRRGVEEEFFVAEKVSTAGRAKS